MSERVKLNVPVNTVWVILSHLHCYRQPTNQNNQETEHVHTHKILQQSQLVNSRRKPSKATWDKTDNRQSLVLSPFVISSNRRLASAWVHCAGSVTYQVTDPEPNPNLKTHPNPSPVFNPNPNPKNKRK